MKVEGGLFGTGRGPEGVGRGTQKHTTWVLSEKIG
jgi:hypothetical protein